MAGTLRPIVIALALALPTACTPTEGPGELRVAAPDVPPPDEAPPPEWGSPFVATDRLAEGRPEQKVRGCALDSDCVLGCVVDGDCCPEPCGCTQIYNVHFLKEVEAHQRSACVDRECPQVKCALSKDDLVAVCQAGLCQRGDTS